MEYADAGSSLVIMMQLKKPFSETEISALLLQVCKGLDYLNNLDPPIVHRDVKAGNILMNSNGECKLADFGVAARLGNGQRQTQIGSPFWMAPEVKILKEFM